MAAIASTITNLSFSNHTARSTRSPLKVISCVSLTPPNDAASVSAAGETSLRVAFAAGGTGGHIFPAVAIADALKLARPDAGVLFLGRADSMESAAVAAAGYDFAPISAVRLARPLISPRNLALPYHVVKSTLETLAELRSFDPQIVVGTGGFVSFPTCLASVFLGGTKLVIQEQNSVPGVANWALSRLADSVLVAFNSTVDCFPEGKSLVMGNPVRVPARSGVSRWSAMAEFFPESVMSGGEKVVLVLGGSLGANAMNVAMLNVYNQMLKENEKLFIIWQTGVHGFDEMESLVRAHPRLHLAPFINSMDLAYLVGDLIISRAGAMTCYEILAHGKPSILIPSPNVTEGHQFKNANLMVDLADARVITEDELDSTTLKDAIEELLGDEKKLADMSERALKAAKPNASAEIANHILSLVGKSSEKQQLRINDDS